MRMEWFNPELRVRVVHLGLSGVGHGIAEIGSQRVTDGEEVGLARGLLWPAVFDFLLLVEEQERAPPPSLVNVVWGS